MAVLSSSDFLPLISLHLSQIDEIGMLAQAAVRHVFAPGETVIRQVIRGRQCSQCTTAGSECRSVKWKVANGGRAQRRRLLGEMALFTGEPRTANVVALEETEVLEIGHSAMKRVFDTNPDLVESLSFIVAERRVV